MRILWITAGVLLALAVVFLIGFSLWVGSYVRGNGFRNLIAGATGREFEATATFEPLQWSGSSVYSESATLKGNPGTGLTKLEASQLRAEANWRAAFSGVWRVEELSIARLEGEWSPAPPAARSAEPMPADPSKSPTGLAALLPRRFELGAVKIEKASLAFGEAGISDSAILIRSDGVGWVFRGVGGEFRLPGLPSLAITDFYAREQEGEYFLTGGNLRLGENGRINVSGESVSGGKLQVGWEAIKAADILAGDWKKRLGGVLSGNALITFPNQAAGRFQLRDGLLENIPLLSTVADFTGNPSFRRMPLQEVNGNFTCQKGVLQITGFSAESKGLMRVEGRAVIGNAGELEGYFQIGVTPQTLQWLPGSRDRVFKSARDGYLWTEIALGGTVEHPTEDLTPRLLSAMGKEAIESGASLLNAAPGTAVDGVNGVLDILRPLIP